MHIYNLHEIQKEIEAIDKILSVVEFGINPLSVDISTSYLQRYTILFGGYNAQNILNTQSELLFNSNSAIKESYTIETFQNEIYKLLKLLYHEKRKATSEDINNLHSELLSVELNEYEVFNEFYGVELNTLQAQFGDFTIYNLELFKDNLY